MGMSGVVGAVVLGSVGVLLAGCAPGNAETDRQADTLGVAIGYPRQSSAMGFARAALATTLGRSENFSVLEAKDFDATGPQDPKARLVIRIHQPGGQSRFGYRDPVNACYELTFNYYGMIGKPDRINCPAGAVAITPPPQPRHEIPRGHDAALHAVLSVLPANPTETEVRAALDRGLPAPPVDPETNLAGIPPDVLSMVRGGDVGVAVRVIRSGDVQCLFGSRVGGDVLVWYPPRVLVQPGETSCDAESALARLATRPPH
ncbi:hypothetical protein [Actinophytocola sp.]|uniref:hypothetical protein n=1 Tax=Actinophytocola sp. TaxID=1872138 RepID=UPI002D8087F3|nr:hypothetical protein [Actinophytocola sp.]HET9139064.1 hypothetical protein [Actinophytocola sp.]